MGRPCSPPKRPRFASWGAPEAMARLAVAAGRAPPPPPHSNLAGPALEIGQRLPLCPSVLFCFIV